MKILFITYYFQPCNSIASNRTNSFYNSMIEAGHHVTVVTRDWSGTENDWNDYIASSINEDIIRNQNEKSLIFWLPYKALILSQNLLIRKIATLISFFKGYFSQEADTLYFIDFIKDLFSKEKYDVLLVSSPPINIVKLGHEIKKFNNKIKFIVDFRDLQNHVLLNLNKENSFKQRLEHFFIRKYLKTWLSNADNILVASEPFGVFLAEINIKSQLLLNGFEEELLKLRKIENPEKFIISVIGTIHPQQEITFFIEVLKLFVANKNPKLVQINLIGINSIPEVAIKFKESLGDFVKITSKIPRKEALHIGKNSNVLAYPGWRGYKGMYSGKIFEYLALGNPILIAPSDNDVKEKIIKECNAGFAANTPKEGENYLNFLFEEWLKKSKTTFCPNFDKILGYSREKSNEKLLKIISEY